MDWRVITASRRVYHIGATLATPTNAETFVGRNENATNFGNADERVCMFSYKLKDLYEIVQPRKFRSHLNTVPWKLRAA